MSNHRPKRLRRSPRRRPQPQSGRAAALWIGGFAAAVIALVLVIPLWLTARSRPASVLLISVDALRLDALGCFGGTRAATPNLDRLAAEGVRFSRCVTASPLTLPSHCSIFTSTWPFLHGVRRDSAVRLAAEYETLTEHLARAGLVTAAVTGSSRLSAHSGLDQGFARFEGLVAADSTAVAGRSARAVTDQALAALQGFGDAPYFLWANYHDLDLFAPDAAPIAETYAASVTLLDAEVGRLLEAVDANGRGKAVLVILVGAQGESLGEHGETGHGSYLYETTLRVPLILRCPAAIPKNQRVDTAVRTIDLMPTVLEYLGRPAAPRAQGTSVRGLVGPVGSPAERPLFAETDLLAGGSGPKPIRSLTLGEWKYLDAPTPELYHLNDDPGETRNLASERAEVLERMRGELARIER